MFQCVRAWVRARRRGTESLAMSNINGNIGTTLTNCSITYFLVYSIHKSHSLHACVHMISDRKYALEKKKDKSTARENCH